MKLFLYALMTNICLILLTSCASSTDHTPDLESFQTRTLPTGSTEAATFAAKTY